MRGFDHHSYECKAEVTKWQLNCYWFLNRVVFWLKIRSCKEDGVPLLTGFWGGILSLLTLRPLSVQYCWKIISSFSRPLQEHPDLLKAFSPTNHSSKFTSIQVSINLPKLFKSEVAQSVLNPQFYICKSRRWNMCTEAVRNVSSV